LPAGQGNGQPSQQPATPAEKDGKPAKLSLGPFPMSGTISYSRWGDLVRQHAPAPTPDVDRVAMAFRDWASHAGLRFGAPAVEKAFVTFCRGFRSRR
jgi:replication initiation protein RepC